MDEAPEMTAAALVGLLSLLEQAGIEVWLDGGWGVDALLGTQTRAHKDADIVVRVSDVPSLRETLAPLGFSVQRGTAPHAFVLGDRAGLELDVHAVAFDGDGNGVYRMESGQDWIYPAEGFGGRGTVEGTAARCLSPAAQVYCHAHGYRPKTKDLRDMALLEERFGVDLPPQLRAGADA